MLRVLRSGRQHLRAALDASAAPAWATLQARHLLELPQFDYQPVKYSGPPKEEVLKKRLKYLSPALFHYYKEPLMITEGKMQYLFDETGRRYLDAFGGIVTVSVGHCHPAVTEAMRAQNALLQHTTTIYLNDQVACFAEELASRLPGDLKVVYFVNSGSEANDLAVLMARAFTGSFDVLALRGGYHGMSLGTMGLTGHATWKFPQAQGFGVHHALNPDPYRGRFRDDGAAYAEDVSDLLATATSGRVAAFVSESIQGVNGAVPLATGYLKATYEKVREAGGLCVADEVQTGFGRTGTAYWGFQNHGVVPDIVTMAKGIGNGVALGAVVTTPAVAEALRQRLHFNTFGGNPVVCAAGRAVLRVIDDEGLQFKSLRLGERLQDGFSRLQGKHDVIGNSRGAGLMRGLELVECRRSKAPAKAQAARLLERCRERGLLLGKGGLHGNVIRIKPPMCLSDADADFIVDVIDDAMKGI